MRRLIEKASHSPVLDVTPIHAGLNSTIAARVTTASRTMFVKGLSQDHHRVWPQTREAHIGPHVPGVAPRLLWHCEADGWSLLAFEYLEGQHADYTPDSPDLPAIMANMIQLSSIPAPAIDLKPMPHRLRGYVDDHADLAWFAGHHLLHTEWNPHNILITGHHARLVDWGWTSTGAPWIDPALWLPWLIAHGHTSKQAEQAAATHPA